MRYDFYTYVDDHENVPYVLYGDTDSLFVKVPLHPDIKDVDNYIKQIATNINVKVIDYMVNNIYNKLHVDENRIDFKTEIVISKMLFLGVKKQYAYITRNGKRATTGILEKVNIPELTKEIIEKLVFDVLLGDGVTKDNLVDRVLATYTAMQEKFRKAIQDFDFHLIGVPCKAGRDRTVMSAMALYNDYMSRLYKNIEEFGQLAAGLLLCIRGTHKFIAVPYNYDKSKIKHMFSTFGIEIDHERQWERVFTTTCKRLIDIVKSVKQI